jgi:hypothetical protein
MCVTGLKCNVYYAQTGRCEEAEGPALPQQTGVQGSLFSFAFAPHLAGSSVFGVKGLPVGTGLAIGATDGRLTGRLTKADAAARQPLVITVVGGTTGEVQQVTLTAKIFPKGGCASASSCAQCGERGCKWIVGTTTTGSSSSSSFCAPECERTGECFSAATCPATACATDAECYRASCRDHVCVKHRLVNEACDQVCRSFCLVLTLDGHGAIPHPTYIYISTSLCISINH